MPATTRGNLNRKTNSEATAANEESKMSEKKALTLEDVLGEIKKGNKKTEGSIEGLERKIDSNQLLLSNDISTNNAIIKEMKGEID